MKVVYIYHRLCLRFHVIGNGLPIGSEMMDEIIEIGLLGNRPVT